mmetsp:Transcript_84461/g.169040  ORF Transcript_84461/g.169040 Transcript_84461/m.169040 type:complete len:195 (+) Transcript_84461:16-600(+)
MKVWPSVLLWACMRMQAAAFYSAMPNRASHSIAKMHASSEASSTSDRGEVSPRRVTVRLGDGSEFMVAKKRKSSSSRTSVKTSAEASAAPAQKKRLQKTTKSIIIPGLGVKIPVKYLTAETTALPAVIAFLAFKKITTGTWLEWGMQSYDNAEARRNVVQGDEELDQLDMLSCEKCGYTIFPALGRTSRFSRYT